MRRFTLAQGFMGVTLLAILIVLPRTEGCGTRGTFISALAFRSDGQSIIVSKINSRDAQVWMKAWRRDCGRTISEIDAKTGRTKRVIHQDYRSGVQTGFNRGCMVLAVNPATDAIVFPSFVHGNELGEILDDKGEVRWRPSGTFYARGLTYSRSGNFLAVLGEDLILTDTRDNSSKKVSTRPSYFRQSDVSFLPDERTLLALTDDAVDFWDLPGGQKSYSLKLKNAVSGQVEYHSAIAMPNDQFLLTKEDAIDLYDRSGTRLKAIYQSGVEQPAVSNDSTHLAAVIDRGIVIYDLANQREIGVIPAEDAATLVFSPDGRQLAVSKYGGSLELYDIATFKRLWQATPPSQYRWPWTVPAILLLLWAYVARRIYLGLSVIPLRSLR